MSILYSTAKSLLKHLKNDKSRFNSHADCRRSLLAIVEAYTDDESDNTVETFDRELQLFNSNLNLIISSTRAQSDDNHPIAIPLASSISVASESSTTANDDMLDVIDAVVDEGPSGVSRLRRHRSEDPHQRQQHLPQPKAYPNF